MSTYVNLPGGPESVVRIGLNLKALAGELKTRAATIAEQITALEKPATWGEDDPGRAFYRRYTQATDDVAFNAALKNQLTNTGPGVPVGRSGQEPLGQIADVILETIANIENSDLDSSRDIQSL